MCEDDDLGGPNCPSLTGPIAVYRFSFAMVLFFSSLMVLTLGISTSKSFRAKIHNGFWLWKFLYAFFLISVSFKLPFFKFGIIKTGKTEHVFYEKLLNKYSFWLNSYFKCGCTSV